MQSKSRLKEADFRPFFDLIVGVVFIFLILLSAQMFFLQSANIDTSSVADETKRSLERMRQTRSFLDEVAKALQKNSIDVEVDLARTELRLSLDQFRDASSGEAPQFIRSPIDALGQVLLRYLKCFQDLAISNVCLDWRMIKLTDVKIDVQTGRSPPGLSLPPDRFGQLVATIFSSSLLSTQPQLLGMTNSVGLPLLQFGSLPSDAKSDDHSDLLRIRFRFGESPG